MFICISFSTSVSTWPKLPKKFLSVEAHFTKMKPSLTRAIFQTIFWWGVSNYFVNTFLRTPVPKRRFCEEVRLIQIVRCHRIWILKLDIRMGTNTYNRKKSQNEKSTKQRQKHIEDLHFLKKKIKSAVLHRQICDHHS